MSRIEKTCLTLQPDTILKGANLNTWIGMHISGDFHKNQTVPGLHGCFVEEVRQQVKTDFSHDTCEVLTETTLQQERLL